MLPQPIRWRRPVCLVYANVLAYIIRELKVKKQDHKALGRQDGGLGSGRCRIPRVDQAWPAGGISSGANLGVTDAPLFDDYNGVDHPMGRCDSGPRWWKA